MDNFENAVHSPDNEGTGKRTCTCGHDIMQRQSSRSSPARPGPQPNAGPINPPNKYSSQDQDTEDVGSGDSTLSIEAQLQIARQRVAQLLREKQDALRQVKEVTKMNTRWQKYDKEREDVVVNLTTRLRQAQDRIQELEAKVKEQRERTEELELRWTDARVRAAERKSELERVQRESQALELQLKHSEKKRHETSKKLDSAMKQKSRREEDEQRGASKDRDLHHMSKRVFDLNGKVDHLELQLTSCQKEREEQVDLYTQQISICLEDFKQEKKDKDQIKRENDDIKKQLKKAEDFASSLKVQITRYQAQTVKPARRQPSVSQVQKYYAHIYQEPLDDSWDDAGYYLPSDVVTDRVGGYDEVDGNVAAPRLANETRVVDLPPKYDDRSILGELVSPKLSAAKGRVPSGTRRVNDLILH